MLSFQYIHPKDLLPPPNISGSSASSRCSGTGLGAFDYIMTQTKNESYMAKFDAAQFDYFYNYPTWLVFFWALAV